MDRENDRDGITRAILDSISEGVFTVDADWRISSINRAAAGIMGIPDEQAIGRHCFDVFRSSMCGEDCALKKTLKTGSPVAGRTGFIISSAGERIPVSISTAVLRDEDGAFIGGVETFRDLSEIEALRTELDGRTHRCGVASHSPAMQKICDIIPAMAASSSTVLIQGETGTGKEVMARSLHYMGPRAKLPFVPVNCGAIPETLLESELFGYRAGAFTGASRDKPGRFTAAGKGTIFLDEISEMNLSMQTKLLRALQEKTFVPLGGSKEDTVESRIIVATNRDLKELVGKGLFREDLFYRINVVTIKLPPLRERREDIPLLLSQFISRFNKLQNKTVEGVDPEAMSLLMAHEWPGNIRELENVVEHAFVLRSSGFITISQLPAEFVTRAGLEHDTDDGKTDDFRSARQKLEAKVINAALKRNAGDRTKTAAELGIHKTTLFRTMKKLGITAQRTRRRSA